MGFFDTGRLMIVSDLVPTGDIAKDKLIIPRIIQSAMATHEQNVAAMDKLFGYMHNVTNVLRKEKVQQPDINNKISINYPYIAVTTINAYCFANAPTFSCRKADEATQNKLKLFNDALDDDSYSRKLMKCTYNSGVCGLGYKYARPATRDEIKQGIYFRTVGDLDPRNTFVVRANNLDKDKVMAVNYYDRAEYDKNYRVVRKNRVYNVWTKYHQWVFSPKYGKLTNEKFTVDGREFEAYPLAYKRIPIVEYPRKQDRTSDFEMGIDLIDAINMLASNRLDDVEQAVDYLITMRDIDLEGDNLEKALMAIKQRIINFRSVQNATVQPEIKVLNTALNQSEVQTLQDFYCAKLEEVLNIPNRETRSSGGDTGSAVESRNGFRSLENIAGIVTASTFEAENEMLDLILAICNNISSCPFAGLTVNDIEIKENRNKVENLESATNAYSTMKSAGMNDEDAIRISRLDPDASTVAKRNQMAQEEQVAKENEVARETVTATATQEQAVENKSGISDTQKS